MASLRISFPSPVAIMAAGGWKDDASLVDFSRGLSGAAATALHLCCHLLGRPKRSPSGWRAAALSPHGWLPLFIRTWGVEFGAHGDLSVLIQSGDMGNCISFTHPKWGSELHNNGMVSIGEDGTHEGIKLIPIQRACEFTTSSALCVCIITWNMNGKMSVEDVTKLVSSNRKFDLLVVGLQEVPKCDVLQILQETMAETHILLGQQSMQSLQLFLFGARSSEKYIRELKVDKQAVGGCGGIIGRKKGAVAMYINFSGIRMVFVSCHLAAHEHKVEKRNSEFQHISHSLFSKNDMPYTQSADVTVWLGDLNYRLQGISSIPARQMIEENRQSTLRRKDQLLQEADKGEVFNGYCEGTLKFKPTYKYNVGSSSYDTSHKIRVPSWTDRILFKVDHSSGLDAILSSYESLDCVSSSDHKPVKAHLCLKVRSADD